MKKISLILLLISIAFGQDSALVKQLILLPGVAVKSIRPDSGFKQAFDIDFTQPLDHHTPHGLQFKQRIILSHVDVRRPVVLITEGYGLYSNYPRELSLLLNANEIRVEHRFFGRSRPDSMIWSDLNIEQAAADHHRIVEVFKKIYSAQWINTGWSKGGQTAIFHRRFYPRDVDVTVAYDAPLNLEREESRIDRFFTKVGSETCRRKIKQFQRIVLQRKTDVLSLFKNYAAQKHLSFSIGLEAALEYAVLEYPFSFWQYHKINCDSIPDENATVRQLFAHLKKVVALSSYSDRALNSAAMYQFFTQLGYYGYVTEGLDKWLSGAYGYSNALFAPKGTEIRYDPRPMQDMNNWLQSGGNRILFIYGANDPWSASSVKLTGRTDALKMTLKNGNHFTFIHSFAEKERRKIYRTLERWLGFTIGKEEN